MWHDECSCRLWNKVLETEACTFLLIAKPFFSVILLVITSFTLFVILLTTHFCEKKTEKNREIYRQNFHLAAEPLHRPPTRITARTGPPMGQPIPIFVCEWLNHVAKPFGSCQQQKSHDNTIRAGSGGWAVGGMGRAPQQCYMRRSCHFYGPSRVLSVVAAKVSRLLRKNRKVME